MKISVVIASYNGEKYIAEQLGSICRQTLAPDEVVICDDCSTDGTVRAAEETAAKYDGIKFRISVNPSPLGCDRNFERAISLAAGDVIYLADQDDIWLPDRLEIMQSILDNSPQPGAVFCDSRIVDTELNDLGYTHWQSRGFAGSDAIFADGQAAFLKRVPAAGHDMAFDSRFREILLPFPELDNCYDTWIGVVLFALGAWRKPSDIPLTLFRRHPESLSGSGVRKGFAGKLREAKKAIADDASGWYAQLYGELTARVRDRVSPEMLQNLEARRLHSLARSRMNVPLLKRLPLILQETRNGNYFRFGRSFLNIAQDIFLRRGTKG
jgi:glycosyltransferase involved in cell wall biosynthesis